jgi:uncharacterized membrane protein
MPNSNRLSLLASFLLMIALPLALGQAMLTSLAKLHMSPNFAILTLIAIVVGGAINIPVKRIVREQPVWSHPLTIWGLDRSLPRWTIRRRETIIAVNVGGCMIPLGIALFQIAYLSRLGPDVAWGTSLATAINIFVCYLAARPVPGVGIVMPGFVSPAAAASAALLLVPDAAPSAAFVAGVLGPLVGADFLHIHDLIRNPRGVGVASIGGAGTFDGIVLSGILATVLA